MEKKKMPHENLTLIQRLQEYGVFNYIWLVMFAAWAGIAKYISERIKAKERPTVGGAFLHTIAPAFVGAVTGFVCQSYKLDPYMTNAIVGVAAYNGVKSIDLISSIIKKEIPNKKDTD